MSGSKRELKSILFKRGATVIRRNGGFIRGKELTDLLERFAWHDAIGRKLTSPERAQLASEVVSSLKANFRVDAYRPVPKVSSPERKSLHTDILSYIRSEPTASYSTVAARFGVSKSTVARIAKDASALEGLQAIGRPFIERLMSLVLPREGRLIVLESTLRHRLQLEFPEARVSLDDEIQKLRQANSPLRLTGIDLTDPFYGKMLVVSRGRNWPATELASWATQTNARRGSQRAAYRLPQLRFVAPDLLVSLSSSSAVRLVCSLVTVLADVEDSHAWQHFFDLVRRSLYISEREYNHKEMSKILSGAFRQGSAEGLQSVARLNGYFLSDLTKRVHKVGTDALLELEHFDGSTMESLLKLGQSFPFVEDFSDTEFEVWLAIGDFLVDVSSPLEAARVLCRTDALEVVRTRYANSGGEVSSFGLSTDDTESVSHEPYIYGNYSQTSGIASDYDPHTEWNRSEYLEHSQPGRGGAQEHWLPSAGQRLRGPHNPPSVTADVELEEPLSDSQVGGLNAQAAGGPGDNGGRSGVTHQIPPETASKPVFDQEEALIGMFPLPDDHDLVDLEGFIYAPDENDD